MAKFRKIGVLTSGGDAPGMNAAVRAVTLSALARGVEVVGIYKGYTGLISGELKELTARDVANIGGISGTILYSDRCLEFKTEEGMAKAVKSCHDNQIDGIVAIGGDGTFRGATDLSSHGIPTIGIPGTIDNDITSTDYSIGFDTAMNTVVRAADALRDTCESHARCEVIEVMGRDAGYIALECGMAVGAVGIAVKELPFDTEACIAKILDQRAKGQRSFIVMVSEGMGGEFGEELTKKINEAGIDTRFIRLAHMVRGGAPTLRDRYTATRMGDYAVDLILQGKSDLVVCEQDNKLVEVDIQYALILDRMYKNKLKDGDLDKFTAEQVESMKAFCAAKHEKFADIMEAANTISKN
ncbi:MAG: 6-phosphofructokinase [Clostridiales bacterium]|nr:6-phosphofructokinase [Clostridiales bacterium]